jgi:hypothetical protein
MMAQTGFQQLALNTLMVVTPIPFMAEMVLTTQER